MTAIEPGSPRFDEIFGKANFPDKFDARGLTYNDIANAFLDPANAALFASRDLINANQTKAMRDGMRLAIRQMSVDFGDGMRPNLPTNLVNGVSSLINGVDIPNSLGAAGVGKIFDTAVKGDAVGAAGAVLGVGLAAVGVAVPVVGVIGSAIVALGVGLYDLIHGQKAKLDKANAEHRALLYQTFPPLQVADSDFDSKLVDQVVLPLVRTRDWTTMFLPRFAGLWVGVEREGGYAFAQGEPQNAHDEAFGAFQGFQVVPNCLGVIPGSDQVTSVIQVSLAHDPADPASAPFVAWTKGLGPDPRQATGAWQRVQDTGVYYPATGRIAFALWSMALKKGSPYKYCLDALKMHEAWRDWADSGLAYIRETCYPWMQKNRRGDGTINPNANYEGYYGTGIYHAVGAWAGYVSPGGTTLHPNYAKEDRPYGVTGPYMHSARPQPYGHPDSSVSSTRSGSWLPIISANSWPDDLMGSRYYRGGFGSLEAANSGAIKDIIDDLQRRQRYELGSTLVSAYVSQTDAAFGDPKLLDTLHQTRAKLLTADDRFWVNMADVVLDDPGVPGKKGTWRDQLIAAGVPPQPRTTVRSVAMAPAGETPPPALPPMFPGPPNPWNPSLLSGNPPRRTGGGVGFGLLGLGLLAAYKARQGRGR